MKKLHLNAKSTCHHAHTVTHITYLVMVFFQSHAGYGIAAGGLAIVCVIGEALDRRERHHKSE